MARSYKRDSNGKFAGSGGAIRKGDGGKKKGKGKASNSGTLAMTAPKSKR